MKLFLLCIAGLSILPARSSATAMVSVEPSLFNTIAGSPFTLSVNISGVSDLYAYQFDLGFAPDILSAVSVTNGLFLSLPADGTFIPGTIDNVGGTVSATADTKTGPVAGVSGSGTLAIFKFHAIGVGNSPTTIPTNSVILLDSNLNDIPFTTAGGSVNVTTPTTSTPEPTSARLIIVGLFGLVVLQSRFGTSLRERQRRLEASGEPLSANAAGSLAVTL